MRERVGEDVERLKTGSADAGLELCGQRVPVEGSETQERQVKDPEARARDQLIGDLISQAHTRGKVRILGIPSASSHIRALVEDQSTCQRQARWTCQRARYGGVEVGVPVVAVDGGLLQLIAKAHVYGKALIHSPGVLKVEAVVVVSLRQRSGNLVAASRAGAKQERSQSIATGCEPGDYIGPARETLAEAELRSRDPAAGPSAVLISVLQRKSKFDTMSALLPGHVHFQHACTFGMMQGLIGTQGGIIRKGELRKIAGGLKLAYQRLR